MRQSKFRFGSIVCAAVAMLLATATANATVYDWISTNAGSYTWSTTSNWYGSTVPTSSGSVSFGDTGYTPTGNITITESGYTVGSGMGMSFAGSNSWTINGSNIAYSVATMYVDAGASINFNCTVAGDSNTSNYLTKTGSGTMTLGGTGDNGGVTMYVQAGTVILNKTGSSDALHAVARIAGLDSGATVQFGSSGSGYGQLNVAGNGYCYLTGGTMDLNGQSSMLTTNTNSLQYKFYVNTSVGGSTSAIFNSAANTSSIVSAATTTLSANLILGAASGGSLTFNSPISGTGGITEQGSGTLILTGVNTYTGMTSIASGSLVVNNTNALQGSTLDYNNGSLQFGTVTSATFAAIQGSQSFALTNNLGNSVALTVGGNSASTTVSGNISGTGSLIKNGPGTLTLSGTNTYSGGTTINAGQVTIGGSSSLGTGALVVNGTLYTAGAYSFYASSLAGYGSISIGPSGGSYSTLYLTNTDSSYFNGTYQGALVKAGSGTLSIGGTGNNSFYHMWVKSGTVLLNKTSGNGVIAVARIDELDSGALLKYTGTGSTQIYQPGYIYMNGGTVDMNGQSQAAVSAFNINTTVGAGTSTIFNSAAATSSTMSATASTLNANLIAGAVSSSNLTLAAPIAGNYGITTTGAGTVTLTGANAYAGATNVASGTLIIGDGNTSGMVAGNIANNGTLAFNRSDAVTYAKVISGSGSVAKIGSGMLTLSGVNTYTGYTVVGAGTLNVTGSIANNDYSSVYILAGASNTATFVRALASGTSFAGYGSTGVGSLTTYATLLSGEAASATNLSMTWRDAASGEGLVSEVLTVNGLTGNYVLSMSYDSSSGAAANSVYIAYTANSTGLASDWADICVGSNLGVYSSSYTTVGDWGTNSDGTLWVVTSNSSGSFAVVPEPGTMGLLAGIAFFGLIVVAQRMRKRHVAFEVC